MHQDAMQWSQCSIVKWIPSECSGFHAVWPNGTRYNAVDSRKHAWMQWILCRVVQCISIIEMYSMPLDVIDTDSMQWIPCSVTECTGFHAAVWNASRVNTVDCMQLGPMDPVLMLWIPCGMIACTGFHAALWNAFRVNAVDCMQRWAMYPGWMQWNPCSMLQWIRIECSGFPAALRYW